MASDSADLGDNGDGYGDLYRIYLKGAMATFAAPSCYGLLAFSHWAMHRAGPLAPDSLPERPQITLTVRHDARVFCFCALPQDVLRQPREVRATLTQEHRQQRIKRRVAGANVPAILFQVAAPPNAAPNVRNRASSVSGVVLSNLPDTAIFTVPTVPIEREGLT